jgi:hypothetical protein
MFELQCTIYPLKNVAASLLLSTGAILTCLPAHAENIYKAELSQP